MSKCVINPCKKNIINNHKIYSTAKSTDKNRDETHNKNQPYLCVPSIILPAVISLVTCSIQTLLKVIRVFTLSDTQTNKTTRAFPFRIFKRDLSFKCFFVGGPLQITWYFPLILLNFFVRVEGQCYYSEQTTSSITWCETGFWIRRFLKFRVQSIFSVFTEVSEVHCASLRRAGRCEGQLLQEQHRHIITRYYGDAEEMIHVHRVSEVSRFS